MSVREVVSDPAKKYVLMFESTSSSDNRCEGGVSEEKLDLTDRPVTWKSSRILTYSLRRLRMSVPS